MIGAVLLQHPAVVFPHFVLFPEQLLGFLHGAFLEPHLLSRPKLCKERKIDSDDRGDFGVAAGGLPVCHHHDGLSGAGNLYAPVCDPVREDIITVRCLDPGTGQPIAHAVAVRGDLIGTFVKSLQTFRGEHVFLRTGDHTHSGGRRIIRRNLSAGRDPAPGEVFSAVFRIAQGNFISCGQGSAPEASDTASQAGTPAPHDRGDVQTSSHGKTAVKSRLPRCDLHLFSGGNTYRPVGRTEGAFDINSEITAAYGDIYCFVKKQHGSDQAEFENSLSVLIADQYIGRFCGIPVHKSARSKAAVLVTRPSLILDRCAGTGK